MDFKAFLSSANKPTKINDHTSYSTAIISQSIEFSDAISEVYVTERQTAICDRFDYPDDLLDLVTKLDRYEAIILDCRHLDDNSVITSHIGSFIDEVGVDKRLLVVGSLDSLLLANALGSKGLDYLVGPSDENYKDYKRFLLNLSIVAQESNRQGKEIAVIGTSGGCGSTLLSSTLATKLSSTTSTLLLEHNGLGSDADYYLGAKGVSSKRVDDDTVAMMDENIALQLTEKVSKNLSFFQVKVEGYNGHFEKTHGIRRHYRNQFNFIVHDISNFCLADLLTNLSNNQFDHIVLVVEPTIRAMRTYQIIMEEIGQGILDNVVTCHVLVNQSKPDKEYIFSSSVLAKKLENYTPKNILELVKIYYSDYDKTIFNLLVSENYHRDDKNKISKVARNIMSTITGRKIVSNDESKSFFKKFSKSS
ncbi:type II/IV secretion system ATPase [Vibrio sp. JCM 19236]|nr:type II/IV secretion system ATPase [Vibrio sp. JCM 19236]